MSSLQIDRRQACVNRLTWTQAVQFNGGKQCMMLVHVSHLAPEGYGS